jgi:hypothetical protein
MQRKREPALIELLRELSLVYAISLVPAGEPDVYDV